MKLFKSLVGSVLLSVALLMGTTAKATNVPVESQGANYSITVHKLKLDQEAKSGNSDAGGLEPFKGVMFEVEKVVPTGDKPINLEDSKTYKEDDSFHKLATGTDAYGEAVFSQLGKGFYLVKELASEQVKQPMKNVLIELPRTSDDGKSLMSNVDIYPKSSIVIPNLIKQTKTPLEAKQDQGDIPQSSAGLTTNMRLIAIGLFIVGSFLIALFLIARKKNSEK